MNLEDSKKGRVWEDWKEGREKGKRYNYHIVSKIKEMIIKDSEEIAVATQSWILRGLSLEPTVVSRSFTS